MSSISFKQKRYLLFLRDVLWLALTAFGGPQAHISLFIHLLVHKRGYLKEQEFLELNALCQMLPGPTSSQTIVAIGYKIGSTYLAFLTLFIWILPAISFMTLAAIFFSYLQRHQISLDFMRFVPPIAIGLVLSAALKVSQKTVQTKTGVALMFASAFSAYYFRSAWIFPLSVLVGGVTTTYKFYKQPKQAHQPLRIRWKYFILFSTIFLLSALIGNITASRFILLFENFYRNGSLIFGGGQVLIPVLFTEFVQQKHYLTSEEFLSGYAIAQCMPGPVFCITAYIGALSLRHFGILGEVAGGFLASAGIFLPGTFLIFFVVHFWEQIKAYRWVRASLEGILAASAGLIIGNALLLLEPLFRQQQWQSLAIVVGAFALVQFSKLPAPLLIIAAILLGIII